MENRRTKIPGFTLLLGGLALCGAGLWILLSPTQYQAMARIKVETESYVVDGTGQDMSYNPYFIQTEFEVIQSQLVLSNVIETLNLNEEWGKKYDGGNPLEIGITVELLKQRMSLIPEINTRIIDVCFRSDDPDEAAKIANAIARAYRDYRWERNRQRSQKGLKVVEDEFKKELLDIEAKQKNLEQLKKQLSLPNPEPSDDILKTNYPSYFQAKQELQKKLDFLKLQEAKIASDKLDTMSPKISLVQLIEAAVPPKSPASPNRWLGLALLVIGLFPTLGGLFLLKSSRRCS